MQTKKALLNCTFFVNQISTLFSLLYISIPFPVVSPEEPISYTNRKGADCAFSVNQIYSLFSLISTLIKLSTKKQKGANAPFCFDLKLNWRGQSV